MRLRPRGQRSRREAAYKGSNIYPVSKLQRVPTAPSTSHCAEHKRVRERPSSRRKRTKCRGTEISYAPAADTVSIGRFADASAINATPMINEGSRAAQKMCPFSRIMQRLYSHDSGMSKARPGGEGDAAGLGHSAEGVKPN